MNIFPAIDLYEGKAVRLYKGDYKQMTVYSEHPELIAKDFKDAGAQYLHVVDLQGAKSGKVENLETIKKLIDSGLKVEVGGGIRTMETIETYLQAGVDAVILGTAAVENEALLKEAIAKYGEKIAVGIDIKDGFVAIKGWLEKSEINAFDFFEKMQRLNVKRIICTDISKDGAMKGTNLELYKELQSKYNLNLIASGGVSSMEDIISLKKMDVFGAIIGKAYYTKAIDLSKAIEEAL